MEFKMSGFFVKEKVKAEHYIVQLEWKKPDIIGQNDKVSRIRVRKIAWKGTAQPIKVEANEKQNPFEIKAYVQHKHRFEGKY